MLIVSKSTKYGGAEETIKKPLLIKIRIIIAILFLSNFVFYFIPVPLKSKNVL